MKVKLAVQMFSKSVAIALRETGREDANGAAVFFEMMNGFFDCTNVRSLTEHQRKKKSLIMPHESPEDKRLTWLKDVFYYWEAGKKAPRHVRKRTLQMIDRKFFCPSKPMKA